MLLTILDYISFVSDILYTLVPAIFLYILQLKLFNEESLSILGILFMYSNALIYFVLSVCNSEKRIEVMDFCNLAGAYLGFIYLFLYLKYLFYNTEKEKFFIFMTIIILTSILVFLAEYFIKISVKVLEWVGIIFNILEYLPLGFNLLYLIKNKISNKFTLFNGVIGLINTIIWLVWAIVHTIKEDENKKIHSIIANVFGLLLSLLQIFLYYCFRNEVTTINADSSAENSIEENNVNDNKSNKKKKEEEPEIMEEFL